MFAVDHTFRARPLSTVALYVFAIRAALDPQALPKIVGAFAQRGVIPHQICSRRSGDYLLIDIEVELETNAMARVLLEKFRAMVVIERANLLGASV